MTKAPPVLATKLLERLGSIHSRDLIAGDLIEQYQRRPSRSRYWRQVLFAILVGAASDLWHHKESALRGAVTGFVVLFLLQKVGLHFLLTVIGKAVWNWSVQHNLDTFRLVWFTYNAPIAVLLVCSCVASGWLVARFDRNHVPPAVFAFTVLMLLLQVGSYGRPVAVHGLRMSIQAAMQFVVMPLCILLGGFVGAGETVKARDLA